MKEKIIEAIDSLRVDIKDGYAEIYLTIDAQEMGCVVVGSGKTDVCSLK